jgi:hypothetical protein
MEMWIFFLLIFICLWCVASADPLPAVTSLIAQSQPIHGPGYQRDNQRDGCACRAGRLPGNPIQFRPGPRLHLGGVIATGIAVRPFWDPLRARHRDCQTLVCQGAECVVSII